MIAILIAHVLEGSIRKWYCSIRKHSLFKTLMHPINSCWFLAFFFTLYIYKQPRTPVPQIWVNNIELQCGKIADSLKNPDRQCFELVVLTLAFTGNTLGAYFEQHYLKTHVYRHWYKTSLSTSLIRTFVCTMCLLIGFSSQYIFAKLFINIISAQ